MILQPISSEEHHGRARPVNRPGQDEAKTAIQQVQQIVNGSLTEQISKLRCAGQDSFQLRGLGRAAGPAVSRPDLARDEVGAG